MPMQYNEECYFPNYVVSCFMMSVANYWLALTVASCLQKDGEYLSGHNMFMKRVSYAFHTFVESTERACREKYMPNPVT